MATDYLNKTGLTYFWQKIKAYISNALTTALTTKQDKLTAGTGISISGNTISVTEEPTRKIIFVGDSYGVGLNPDGSSNIANWVDLTAARMGLASGDYYNWSVSGAGFIVSDSNKKWNNIITNNYSSVSSIASKITDVVIGGGINDARDLYDGSGESLTSTVQSAAETAIANAQSKFPNAKIWIAPFGWCRGIAKRRIFMCNNIFFAYSTAAYNKGAIYVDSAEFVLHNYGLFASDYYHPNVTGEKAIADIMSSALMGCPKITSSLTKNSNNQEYLYSDIGFTKASGVTLATRSGDTTAYQLLSYMDGRNCYFYASFGRITGNFACNGTEYTMGTVTKGHFASKPYGDPYGQWPGFITPCTVKKKGTEVYTHGTLRIWFEEPSTPATGGTVNIKFAIIALDPSSSSHAWVTSADTIFDINLRNCSLPAALC